MLKAFCKGIPFGSAGDSKNEDLEKSKFIFFRQETLDCKDDFQDKKYCSPKQYTGQGSRLMENREAKTFALSFWVSPTYLAAALRKCCWVQ